MNDESATPHSVRSSDGTDIAYETRGSGLSVILVGGAFNDRRSPAAGLPLGELLAPEFTVIAYDRRGRGDSGDAPEYAVEREIEDLRALADAVGPPAFLFGHSSGGALAIEAVLEGLHVRGLAIFETPYTTSEDGEARSRAMDQELRALLDAGDRAEAVSTFLTSMGMPPGMIGGMRSSPMWRSLEALAPTLAYDIAVLRRRGTSSPPLDGIATIPVPVLAVAGSRSPDWMRHVTRAIASAAPKGAYLEIEGDHAVPPEAIAPGLREWLRSHMIEHSLT